MLGPGPRRHSQRGDCGNRDSGAHRHDKGGDDSRPEQPLRQREYQHQDRSRARPQADRDNCGEPALPSSRPCELLRLRRVRVPPGRGFFVRMRMMVRFAVRMAVVIVLVTMMVMVRMIVMVAMVRVLRM